jgi:hypothetical protein
LASFDSTLNVNRIDLSLNYYYKGESMRAKVTQETQETQETQVAQPKEVINE